MGLDQGNWPSLRSYNANRRKPAGRDKRKRPAGKMSADWGAVAAAAVLFVLFTPGLLFQCPAPSGRCIGFNTLQTGKLSIVIHTVLYTLAMVFFVYVIGVHVYTG
ncbi:unnamed protein product [Cuscuta epithymum]|nr:unnamed protein product [Cuscuta epithymum]